MPDGSYRYEEERAWNDPRGAPPAAWYDDPWGPPTSEPYGTPDRRYDDERYDERYDERDQYDASDRYDEPDQRDQPLWTPPKAPRDRPLVEVEHLTKIYEPSPKWMKLLLKSSITEPVVAVKDLSLQVWPGQVFAVVGPNGAGKSTLFRVLTGLIIPSSGRVALAGIDVIGDARKARRHIGFMPAEDRSLNLRHTCWQNLAFHGRLQGIPSNELGPRIDEALETVGLGHVPDRTGHALSSGMRARLQLARALLHEPDILVLDEPTGTIDPVGAHDLLQLVQRLAEERQLAVLLSSHRLEEIDALEDNVLFLNRGEVVHTGSMDSLRAVMEQPILRLRFDSAESARSACDHLLAARDLSATVDGDEVHVAGNPSPGLVLPRLGAHLGRLEAVDRSRMPLQELISRLMRGGAPPAPAPSAPPAPSDAPAPGPAARPPAQPLPPAPYPDPVPPPDPAPPAAEPAPWRGASWRGASWRPSQPPGSVSESNGTHIDPWSTNGSTNGSANAATNGSANGSSNGSHGNGSRPW